ncbi:MAG: aminodeoxychorismate/anthranilate synthase component II [Candidatus Bathyarchaeota archaeon]|nr:aminodeoxychorismate/anthranilate synthase component II [Candidatus Bathyarchaeum tardum]WGM89680.1 MAG: aminodeoxychorismate/anthranilate synthase component II [Candidatus Bathyarchaeum tardum]WNZ30220.1 MAG: aminodeoxychorismate/anthranilate synthase component II [Candidatus Bathyarchaeota archaeon]
MKVLVIDNYDSFVYNLVQYIGELGGDPIVYRNDQLTLQQAMELNPERIVISPGPGTPEDPHFFGVCSAVLKEMSCKTPTLGVCLGNQGIISVFGGKVVRASRLMHGKTSRIKHDSKGLFEGVKNPFTATRYHSLVGQKSSIPSCIEVSAKSVDDGEIMAVRHKEYPITGVQFHPESILCEDGKKIIKNFLEGRNTK